MTSLDESWNLDRLAQYVLAGLEKIARLETQVKRLGRRTAVEVHRIGHALSLAQEQTKPRGQWTRWLAKHGIPRMTAWEAIKLYQSATEAEVAKLTITEAKMKFGIYPEFMPEDEDTLAANGRQPGGADAEKQLSLVYRRLKAAMETVSSLDWERELLYSIEVDEILQFCQQVVRAISQQRKTVGQPKRENTKRYLAHLRSL